jgi:hypothetical protein
LRTIPSCRPTYQGHSYFFYHNGALPGGGGYKRSVCVEEFSYGADGSIPTIKMTTAGPAPIAILNPFRQVEAETIAFSSGLKTEACSDIGGGLNVTSISNGDYIKVRNVDLLDGVTSFDARVSSAGSNAKIELHLDSQTGTLLGTCDVSGASSWTTKTCQVSGGSGKHDLFLKFTGGSGDLFKFNWWKFTGPTVPNPDAGAGGSGGAGPGTGGTGGGGAVRGTGGSATGTGGVGGRATGGAGGGAGGGSTAAGGSGGRSTGGAGGRTGGGTAKGGGGSTATGGGGAQPGSVGGAGSGGSGLVAGSGGGAAGAGGVAAGGGGTSVGSGGTSEQTGGGGLAGSSGDSGAAGCSCGIGSRRGEAGMAALVLLLAAALLRRRLSQLAPHARTSARARHRYP